MKEDGIVDEIAIEIAASGEREVALTPGERDLAVAMMVRRGATLPQICQRLAMGTRQAAKRKADLTALGQAG